MKRMNDLLSGFVVLGLLLGGVSCSGTAKAVRSLPEDDRQFLEDVAPLISPDEKRDFLFLKDIPSREAFRAAFWKRRDTDPSTETNEFREQYYQRMEEARRLFGDERHGRGHLTDRGRTYLLFGPPDSRYVALHVLHPYEVWTYGPRILRFTDPDRHGTYRLDPISASNAGFWNLAQIAARGGNWRRQTPASSRLGLHLERGEEDTFVLFFQVPLEHLVFRPDAQGKRVARIRSRVEVRAGQVPMEAQEQVLSLVLDPDQKEVEKSRTMPVRLRLPKGEVHLRVTLKDLDGDWQGEEEKVYRIGGKRL